MKNRFLTSTTIIAVLLMLCLSQGVRSHVKQQDSRDTQAASTPKGRMDMKKIPLSNAELGSFPYLSAPQGYKYADVKERGFEEKYFFYDENLLMSVEGKYMHTCIFPSEGSDYEETYVVKNYERAIAKLGGVEIYSGGSPEALRSILLKETPRYAKDLYDPIPYRYKQFVIRKPESNVWIELLYGLNSQHVELTVMLESELEETIEIIKSDQLKDAIAKEGKAVLYINFDVDKASLKPEGVEAVDEITKLMQSDKALNLSIEGHTDNTGSAAHNKKLSEERAKTVVDKLKESGIASDRLKWVGHGAEKPLVPNDSDENRAKNRRVEIVKIN